MFVVLPYKIHLVTIYLKIALYLYLCVCVCVCVCVCARAHSQWCLILCDPMHCSPPGSSVHGILQARTLEQVATSSSKGSSPPGMELASLALAGRYFTIEPPGKPRICIYSYMNDILCREYSWKDRCDSL